ncbi:MAG TPA: hypothetical protein VM686_22425, partial [Polyangiaceae bacterium]|nr:hypothetical protein [Polyangiaceae bacterium]
MWFWFGLVTSLKFAALASYLRFQASWSGESRSARGHDCEVRVSTDKNGRLTGVRVGVPCRADFQFTVRRQNALDNFFLKVGLAAEQTVQDVVFDDSVYLLSDDRRLGQLLRGDEKMRHALRRLLYEYNDGLMRVQHVRCGHGRLWVSCLPVSGGKLFTGDFAADRVIRSLRRVAKGLAGKLPVSSDVSSDAPRELGAPTPRAKAPRLADASPEARPGDRAAGAAALLLTASTALFLNGIFQLFVVLMPTLPIVLDNSSLITTSVLVGVACTVALLSLCAALLRKTSRVHVVAMELLVTGTFGCLTTSYAVLREVNASVDGMQPTFVDVGVWG